MREGTGEVYIRQCLRSDGRLQQWKWPKSLGQNYTGPGIEYSEQYVKLSDLKAEKLKDKEARVKATDHYIRTGRRSERMHSGGIPAPPLTAMKSPQPAGTIGAAWADMKGPKPKTR